MNPNDIRPLKPWRVNRLERKRQTFRQSTAKNEALFCKYPGCNNHRYGFTGYCDAHRSISRRVLFYGHVNGRRIKRREYPSEFNEVRELITLNTEHPAIAGGIEHVSAWLKLATSPLDCTARRIAFRLIDGKVPPEAVLIALIAAWLYWWRRKDSMPNREGWNEKRTLPLHLGWCVNGLVKPDGQYISHTDVEALGRMFLERLAGLFVNVARSLERKAEKKRAEEDALSQPIE
jgi:hypothetical protein